MTRNHIGRGCFLLSFFSLCGGALWWSETRLVEYPRVAPPAVIQQQVTAKHRRPPPPRQSEQGMSITRTRSFGAGHEDAGFGINAWASYGSPPDLGFTSGSNSTVYNVRDTFGFSIPSTATIVGIQPTLERWAVSVSNVETARIRIVKGGSIGTTELKTSSGGWATSPEWETVGGPANLCGTTWTPANINSTGFGVALAGKTVSLTSGGDCNFGDCDITVYYTVPDALGSTNNPAYNWMRYINPRTRLVNWDWLYPPARQPVVLSMTRTSGGARGYSHFIGTSDAQKSGKATLVTEHSGIICPQWLGYVGSHSARPRADCRQTPVCRPLGGIAQPAGARVSTVARIGAAR